jgi:hypothetical protein
MFLERRHISLTQLPILQLLYSLTSLACVINPEYADPENFDQVFDIFSTQSLTSAHLIDYQFGQLVPQNQSLYDYNSKRLNDSNSNITESIDKGHAVSGGYLMATLQAYNATDVPTTPNTDGNNSGAGGNNTRSPNTALAMSVPFLCNSAYTPTDVGALSAGSFCTPSPDASLPYSAWLLLLGCVTFLILPIYSA